MTPAARIRNLDVRFPRAERLALRSVSLDITPGEIVGLVGESGSGKSLLGFTLGRLEPAATEVRADTLEVASLDLLHADPRKLAALRRRKLAYIFQEPLSALSPVRRLGLQMTDVITAREGLRPSEAKTRALDLLKLVEIEDPVRAFAALPSELSGGMRQRALIALAFLGSPALVVADEVTTAIDAILRRSIVQLAVARAREVGAAVLLISHDLAVVRAAAERIVVLYKGEIVEEGPCHAVLEDPRHPYTQMLLNSAPERGTPRTPLAVPGDTLTREAATGCAFQARCPNRTEICRTEPALTSIDPNRAVRCWRA